MNNFNPFFACDGYKVNHHQMYPQGTTLVYSNWTPRSGKHSNVKNSKGVVVFGTQMVMKQIQEMFDEHFFQTELRDYLNRNNVSNKDYQLQNAKDRVCSEIKKEYSMYLDTDYDVSHIEALWDLGYLPIEVKALPEGSFCPYGVPALTIKNTKPEFFWLTNFLETLISNMLWMPMTSATTALDYKRTFIEAARKTDKEAIEFVDFQGHNFSMRGMGGLDATIYSGLGHATCFKGDDSLPTIMAARKYYNEEGFVVGSVAATEHSVMCAGTKDDEIGTFRYLMNQFPTGILSIVSDTWDLWTVITSYLVILKDEILARDGKIVIRPDSGDPVDIICGEDIKVYSSLEYAKAVFNNNLYNAQEHGESWYNIPSKRKVIVDGKLYMLTENTDWNRYDKQYYYIEHINISHEELDIKPSDKGVIELLWDIFGGTVNEQDYKVLNPKIGCIYGDSITPARAKEICERLESKGFASTNVVLGIGSYTYQMVTRDTHGFAMKATYVEVKCEGQTCKDIENGWDTMQACEICNGSGIIGREIFKDPITDDGTKKSAKGLLKVYSNVTHQGDFISYGLLDQQTWENEKEGALQTIFKDGKFVRETTLTEIRERINKLI